MKIILLIIFLSIQFQISAQSSENKELSKSQNFILEDIDGEIVELEEELGEGPILLSFWATWCKPCKEELKEYNKIYNKYAEHGLKLFAVSVDNEKSIAKVKPYVKTNGFEFSVLLDVNSEVARMYHAQMVPYSVIMDRSGKIVYSHLGYKKGDEIEAEKVISELLNNNG